MDISSSLIATRYSSCYLLLLDLLPTDKRKQSEHVVLSGITIRRRMFDAGILSESVPVPTTTDEADAEVPINVDCRGLANGESSLQGPSHLRCKDYCVTCKAYRKTMPEHVISTNSVPIEKTPLRIKYL